MADQRKINEPNLCKDTTLKKIILQQLETKVYGKRVYSLSPLGQPSCLSSTFRIERLNDYLRSVLGVMRSVPHSFPCLCI